MKPYCYNLFRYTRVCPRVRWVSSLTVSHDIVVCRYMLITSQGYKYVHLRCVIRANYFTRALASTFSCGDTCYLGHTCSRVYILGLWYLLITSHMYTRVFFWNKVQHVIIYGWSIHRWKLLLSHQVRMRVSWVLFHQSSQSYMEENDWEDWPSIKGACGAPADGNHAAAEEQLCCGDSTACILRLRAYALLLLIGCSTYYVFTKRYCHEVNLSSQGLLLLGQCYTDIWTL